MMVSQKEIIKALRFVATPYTESLAARIESEGIAPPDNMNLEIRFGLGLCVVDTGEFNGRPAVIIQPSDNVGEVGSSAENEPAKCYGNIVLTFPEKSQMKLVADALVNCIAPPDGWVLVPWQTLDGACELLELHGEHEHPDYKALKATTSAKVKGVSDEQ